MKLKSILILGYPSICQDSFYIFSKANIAFKIEQEVTNGLGYNKIPHYEDSNYGLQRHLREMEIRVNERAELLKILSKYDFLDKEFSLDSLDKRMISEFKELLPEMMPKQIEETRLNYSAERNFKPIKGKCKNGLLAKNIPKFMLKR